VGKGVKEERSFDSSAVADSLRMATLRRVARSLIRWEKVSRREEGKRSARVQEYKSAKVQRKCGPVA
jgi:hypothetical protein